jgi:hypothetical protein
MTLSSPVGSGLLVMGVACGIDSVQAPSVPRGQPLGMQSQTAGIRPKPSATALVKIRRPALQESGEMVAGNQFLPRGRPYVLRPWLPSPLRAVHLR